MNFRRIFASGLVTILCVTCGVNRSAYSQGLDPEGIDIDSINYEDRMAAIEANTVTSENRALVCNTTNQDLYLYSHDSNGNRVGQPTTLTGYSGFEIAIGHPQCTIAYVQTSRNAYNARQNYGIYYYSQFSLTRIANFYLSRSPQQAGKVAEIYCDTTECKGVFY